MKKNYISKLMKMLLVLVVIAGLNSCYYFLDEDENPTNPGGTGVQGYKLMIRIIPSTVPATGSSSVVAEIIFMDMENQTPVANQYVFLQILEDVGEGTYIPFDKELAYFPNGLTTVRMATESDGTIHVPIHIGDAYYKTTASWIAYLHAEVINEFDTPEMYVSDIDSFMIYNPYY